MQKKNGKKPNVKLKLFWWFYKPVQSRCFCSGFCIFVGIGYETSILKKQHYPSIPLAQILIRTCVQHKIQHIVICAGSRNAPLTNGFVSHPFFTTYSIVDERAAAFFGLGIAQQLQQPVAVVCTSGSALLNFYPAVAEAFYSDIPLVIISADRMPHRIDIGDGQTIRQTGVFEPHLEASAELMPDVSHATQSLLESPLQTLIPKDISEKSLIETQIKIQTHNHLEIARVLQMATTNKGPVHLNIPLEEPLYGMTTARIPLDEMPKTSNPPDESLPEQDRVIWKTAKKKWVMFGVLPPDTIAPQWITALCNDPSVAVFTEKTSNLIHPNAIDAIDVLMAPLEQEGSDFYPALQPELLVTFGGMIVSKKVKAFLRKYPPQQHWHIDSKKAYNTYYVLERHFKMTPNRFFETMYSETPLPIQSDYQSLVLDRFKHYKTKGDAFVSQSPFSDLKAFQIIFKNFPKGVQLQLANSSTIRYAQLFDVPKSVAVFCNRGTSGIDGSTATAVGAAQVQAQPVVLITGDLSFFYDVNGLWNNYIPAHFRIIIINNGGGGIFRILPGEKDSEKYDTYFETIHYRNAKDIAKAFGFKYKKVDSQWGLKYALKRFYKLGKQPKILEVQTPRKLNDKVLMDYFRTMATK